HIDLAVLTNPGTTLTLNGGAGGHDAIVLEGSADSVAYNPSTLHDGTFVINGSSSINFTGLDPATIAAATSDLTGNLPNVVNTDVVLANNATRGRSQLTGSTFENLTFVNPTSSFTIHGGSLADTISLAGLDAGWAADLTIDSQTGGDTIKVIGLVSVGGN